MSNPPRNRLESLVLTMIFTAVSLGLLAALPWATRPGADNSGWWTAPALAPAAALVILCLANLATLAKDLIGLRSVPLDHSEKQEGYRIMAGWLRPLEYLVYFSVYVAVLHITGYFLSSLLFILWLMWRQGLRSARWMLAGLCVAVALTLIFRVGLQIWMPRPWLFEHLPGEAAKFAARWL